MKKFAVLALLAAFTLGTVGVAYAVEIKARGTWRVQFNYISNADFDDRAVTDADKFSAQQRMRTIFEFIASENLRGVLQLEIGDLRWGNQGVAPFAGRHIGGGVGTDGVNIETRHAFINFKLPDTKVDVNAGLLTVGLPATWGSHILAADMAALTAHVPFTREVGLTLGWGRPHDEATAGVVGLSDEVDVFFGVLPVRLTGATLNPFVAVSRWGHGIAPGFTSSPVDITKNSTMWHTGLNFRVIELAPITILGDLNYGSVDWGRVGAVDIEQAGWAGVLAAQYSLGMVTPQIFGVYESGEDAAFATVANADSNRMPVIHTDGGAFGPGIGFGTRTSFAGDRQLRTLLDIADPTPGGSFQAVQGAVGLWALGFALRDIRPMDKLSTEFVTFYAKGTNHRANVNMFTTEDSYWEVNLNTTYQMYENLALILELAYGDANLDRTLLPVRDISLREADDALTRGVLGMVYRF